LRSRIIRFFLIFILVMAAFSNFKLAAETEKRVLIIDLPRFTFDDISKSCPNLLQFARTGGVAVMTTPLQEPVTVEKVYFGFNSGTQVKTAEESLWMFDVGENFNGVPVGTLYQTLTGKTAPVDGAVQIGIGKISLLNSTSTDSENIGLFGRLLHQNAIKTAAIGNADADLVNRCGSAMVMDENGQLDLGAVGPETLEGDPQFPYGFRTDLEKVYSVWQEFQKQAQVTVITLGDLERIERFSVYLSDSRWQFYRKQVLLKYDRLLGRFLKEIDFDSTMVILFSALPPKKGLLGERLTPAIIKGPGFKPGLLFSRSTRKPGLITYYDLSATALKFLDVNRLRYVNGRGLESTPGDWRVPAREQPQLVDNYNFRWPLLTVYGNLLIGLALAMAIGLILRIRQTFLFTWLKYLYLFLLTVPAVFLLEALINPLDWGSILVWTLGLGGLIFAGAVYFSKRNPFSTLSGIGLFTILVIFIDGIFNGAMELRSFLGYSAVSGARFYGIGNEYMGIFLGAYIVTVSLNFERLGRFKHQILWLGMFFISILLVHPGFGANIGGGITALIGLGITTYLWLERPVRIREIVGLIAACLSLLVLVGFWEFRPNGNTMTHFGQLISLIRVDGFKAVVEVIGRKWALNMRLIDYTPWSKVIIGLLLAIPLIYKRPPALVAGIIEKYPQIIRGFLGLTITAIIALLVNDSGIASVATMFIFGFIMLLLVMLKEWGRPEELERQ
jgi:hypothetical protein